MKGVAATKKVVKEIDKKTYALVSVLDEFDVRRGERVGESTACHALI